jgi:hypothetical protein
MKSSQLHGVLWILIPVMYQAYDELFVSPFNEERSPPGNHQCGNMITIALAHTGISANL